MHGQLEEDDIDADDLAETTTTIRRATDPTPRVLVVDDDTSFLSGMNELLTGEGYEVATAPPAEDAVDRLRSDTYHLVLCDLQLPGRNGIALIKAVHEACP